VGGPVYCKGAADNRWGGLGENCREGMKGVGGDGFSFVNILKLTRNFRHNYKKRGWAMVPRKRGLINKVGGVGGGGGRV